ncbi:hypothetical protein EDD16DRAFT_1198574 [Pisolithus croceorrhizus]|nr:hypothetical protein EDD16DRAFT_1198574 [Pisolithus croceorrhizus]KAI6132943.1 hypothetical protein EV401DRAFT_163808 [Pisolithus croceorrhizus]
MVLQSKNALRASLDLSNSILPCPMLLKMYLLSRSYTLEGAVGDAYFPPAQPQLVPNAMDPTRLVEGMNSPSPRGLVSRSCSSGDSVQYTSESYPVVHSGVTCMLHNTTCNAELGLSQVDDARIGFPQSVVQETGAPANESRYANCPTTRCLYPGTGEILCLQEISCPTVPSHFATHGVENKSRMEMIHCKWRGCVAKVTRHGFVRHIREVHLQHRRGTSAHTSKNDLRATKTIASGSLGKPIDLVG